MEHYWTFKCIVRASIQVAHLPYPSNSAVLSRPGSGLQVEVYRNTASGLAGTYRIVQHVESAENDLTPVSVSANGLAFEHLAVNLPGANVNLKDVTVTKALQVAQHLTAATSNFNRESDCSCKLTPSCCCA